MLFLFLELSLQQLSPTQDVPVLVYPPFVCFGRLAATAGRGERSSLPVKSLWERRSPIDCE